MSFPTIQYCPGTLAEGFDTYSPAALRRLFDGHRVSHVLDFDPPAINRDVADRFRSNQNHMSISGAQTKQSLVLEKNKLRLTEAGERGGYILKPIPENRLFHNITQIPANEHLTMQIARQVFGIETAENALIFFKNGEPAYITKRFDRTEDGTPVGQEDFAALLGHSKQRYGEEFKFKGSYEDIALCMKRFVGAYRIEAEKFYDRVVFNHVFHNQDAHLKNFSLRETTDGDYLLSPAYDLLFTRLHVGSGFFFTLEDGLWSEETEHNDYLTLGFPAYDNFHEFGKRIGLQESRIVKVLAKYLQPHPKALELINRSYLTAASKTEYAESYVKGCKAMGISMTGQV
jgi:serine/threonine-protein kinase HipA